MQSTTISRFRNDVCVCSDDRVEESSTPGAGFLLDGNRHAGFSDGRRRKTSILFDDEIMVNFFSSPSFSDRSDSRFLYSLKFATY